MQKSSNFFSKFNNCFPKSIWSSMESFRSVPKPLSAKCCLYCMELNRSFYMLQISNCSLSSGPNFQRNCTERAFWVLHGQIMKNIRIQFCVGCLRQERIADRGHLCLELGNKMHSKLLQNFARFAIFLNANRNKILIKNKQKF